MTGKLRRNLAAISAAIAERSGAVGIDPAKRMTAMSLKGYQSSLTNTVSLTWESVSGFTETFTSVFHRTVNLDAELVLALFEIDHTIV
jgi:hypothetical protein